MTNFTQQEIAKAEEMFSHISQYSKEEQLEMYKTIDKFLWDSNLSPEEFLIAFANMDENLRKKWFAKILTTCDLYYILKIFTPYVVYKYAFDEDVINQMFPESHQRLWRSIKKNIQKLYKTDIETILTKLKGAKNDLQ